MGRVWSYLKDVLALTMLPLCGDTHSMGVVLDDEDPEKLDFLNRALSKSRGSSNKDTYPS